MNSKQNADYMKGYQKRRRERLKAEGICGSCQKRPLNPGNNSCRPCLDDKRITSLFKHGEDKEKYYAMLKKQAGKCALCGKIAKKLFIDHCHSQMIIRELLCQKCNLGLAMLNDDATLIRKAASYVAKYSKKN